MSRARLALALVLALLAPLAATAPAQAGRYDVRFCDSSGPFPAGSYYSIELGSETGEAYRGRIADACGNSGLGYYISGNAQRMGTTNGIGIKIPDELGALRIRALTTLLGFGFGPSEDSTWYARLVVPGRTLFSGSSRGGFDVQESVRADGLDTRGFEFLADCSTDRGTDCSRYSEEMFSVDVASLTLEDPVAPDSAEVGGDLEADGPKRGTVTVTARGGDVDSGVRSVRVALGPTVVGERISSPVKGQWRPYPRLVADEFAVDTTKLADATYPLTLTVADAGGASRDASGGDVVVDNLPPVPTGPPAILGATDAGQTLTASPGSWKDLNGEGFAYQWLRCNAAGDLCQKIPGATGATHGATPTDVGSTLRVEIVAADASGTATQTSAPSAEITGVPSADAPNPPTLLGVRGLTNPLAGKGGVPNGANASPAAKLVAGVRAGRRTRRTVVGRFGSRPVVVATLKAGGKPVSGAQVTVAERPVGRDWRAVTTVTTDARGRLRATIPPGPNRSLQLFYFPTGAATEAVRSRKLNAQSKAGVTFSVSPRSVRNRGLVAFAGRVLGGTSPRGTLVSLQVKTGSRRWQAFRVTRSTAAGDYKARFRFLRSRPGQRYSFRAVAKRQSGLPYNTGTSRTRGVRVR